MVHFFIHDKINNKALNETRCPIDYKRYSIRAVLFEASNKSTSCKPLSLMKIENSLLLFLSNTRSSRRRLSLQNRSFNNFSKVLEKICEGVCFLVKLQTVDHNPIKNQFLRRYILQILLKS